MTDRETLTETTDDVLRRYGAELVAFRRDLHAHPELSREEHRTTEVIAERLASAGLEPKLLPGTGVTVDVGEGDGRLVALRGDIDALPIEDAKDVPYRSRTPGVTHACGHDVHTAIAFGCALTLRDTLRAAPGLGRVRLIFQPAEEVVPGGALDVVEAGALDGVERIFSLHCDPRHEVGVFGVREGPISAASDRVTIRLRGPGGHTARPHLTVDMVQVAAKLAVELPAAMSRLTDSRAMLTFVFGSIHSGTAPNVIPTSATLDGSLRILGRATWEAAPELLERLVRSICDQEGAQWVIDHSRGAPPVINEATSTQLLRRGARAALDNATVRRAEQSLGGEDFSWYLEKVPGSYGRLGIAPPGAAPAPDLHTAAFDVDERAIDVGVRVLTHTALEALGA